MNWISQIFEFFRQFQFWIVIAPWEAALRVRLGKRATVLNPGPHWKIPFFDTIFTQATRLRTIADSGQTMATKDGKNLTLAVAVSYSINDIHKLYMTVSNPELTLLFQIQALLAETIAESNSKDITPLKIEAAVAKKLPAMDWGLADVKVMVTTFAFVRTYRILNYADRTMSGANDLEQRPNTR